MRNFTPPSRSSNSIWFCGCAGSGKTSLACALASAVAIAGHNVRYVSVVDILQAQDNAEWLRELRLLDLFVIDWTGIHATRDDKASRDQADLLGCLSRHAVGGVLDARHKDDRPTLLIADCDRLKLGKYLGKNRFERLQGYQIVDF